jgi:hypothetical protein
VRAALGGPLKLAIAVTFFILGALSGYFIKNLGRPDQTKELWDLHFVGLMQDLGILTAIYEENLDLVRQQSDTSAHAHLLALKMLEGSNSVTVPIETKVRVLNGMYLEWEDRPPFVGPEWDSLTGDWVPEWRKDVKANFDYLKWAHGQCNEHPEYDCKQKRGRRVPAT